MLKRFSFVLSLAIGMVLLAILPALAESVDTAWVRRYNGPDNGTDGNCYLVLDGTGNVYVAGSSWGTAGDFDFAMVKYSSSGNEEWVRRYNGPGNDTDFVYALAVDKFNDVYVTGASKGSGTLEDYTTIKYHPNGDTAWVRRYNGPGNDEDFATAVTVDTSGNVCVTGGSFTPGTGWRYVTIKYNPSGDTVWLREYGEYDSDAIAIVSDDPGNFYVTGRSAQQSGSFKNYDFATIKYLPNGDTAWVRRYNGTSDSTDVPRAITVDGSGNVYVTGESYGTGTSADYLTIKYYPNGNTAWEKRYNNPWDTDDYSSSIALDAAGNIFVAGVSGGHNFAIKYNTDGDTVWTRRYQSETYPDTIDIESAIVTDDCDNLYLTGTIHTSDTLYDYFTIKYKPNGDTAWVKKYNGPGSSYDIASAIAVYGCDDVYVTGSSVGDGTGLDYATIKYVQDTTDVIDETENREKPSEFTLSQNYPNPFNQFTKIEFSLARSGFVNLSIYDILGRKVRTLVSQHLSSGYKSVLWDGKNDSGKEVASGIYFYRIKVEDSTSDGVASFSETKKLLLLK